MHRVKEKERNTVLLDMHGDYNVSSTCNRSLYYRRKTSVGLKEPLIL